MTKAARIKECAGIPEKLAALENTVCLCIGILDREKNGRGPENPETLKQLLENHRLSMLDSIKVLKCTNCWKEEHLEHISRLGELVEKFDLGTLEQAHDIINELK
jgi:hypothetical protein